MNHIVLRCATSLALLLAASVALPSVADDPNSHESHHPKDSAAAAAPAVASPAVDASSTVMSNMKTMQDQMAKIHAATDPKVRSTLLDEHLKTMQNTMKLMMSSGGGCPMMGGGSPGQGGMMGNGNMMQMMMDQMMQHQNMMQAPAK